MKVRLKLFAVAKQLAGCEVLELELPAEADVAALRTALLERVPALEPLSRQLAFAVNMEYAGDGVKLSEEADVACIPPVSGG